MIAAGILVGIVALTIITQAARNVARLNDDARLIKMKRMADASRNRSIRGHYRVITRKDDSGDTFEYWIPEKDK